MISGGNAVIRRALILVEGHTEERFVTQCLSPYLLARGLAIRATIVNSKRVVDGPSYKGGVDNYDKVHNHLQLLFRDTNAVVITTLFDYYRLPTNFPGMSDRPPGSARSRCEFVEASWATRVHERRFVPHVVLHELEAWVYVDPSSLDPKMFDDNADVVKAIADTAKAYASPEDINEGPQTAPSKRLKKAWGAYQKTIHGPRAITAIGIDRIRATCGHFDRWLSRLEDIAMA